MGSNKTKRLSWLRLFALLLIIGFFINYLYTLWIHKEEESDTTIVTEPWFASYVDVTAKPTYGFEQNNVSNNDIVLSFIVASKEDPCLPTWGTYHTMDDAAIKLDLDRRIARLRQQNGAISISFGGVINDELALKCTDESKLYNAYKSVIDRYKLDTIDLDLESENLQDTESMLRRAIVLSRLQQDIKDSKGSLAIWLTLPVAPQGLTEEGTNAVSIMLQNKVDLSGVNVMTMNYADSKEGNQNLLEASKRALLETHRQLKILYSQNGLNLRDSTLWKKIGATPMIGQNDIKDEVFTLEYAKELNIYAISMGVGRMSMWSANRDLTCGENYADLKVVSDSCSGVEGEKGEFIKILSEGFLGTLTQSSKIETPKDEVQPTMVIDDPDRSPYQIWNPNGVYPKGSKVVWKGTVYEAKWWSKNDMPDNPILQYWETPWKLMGPVLVGETPVKQPTLPTGTYPEWDGQIIYQEGDLVLFEGIPFQAKWWNEGESPAESAFNPDSSPWLPLTQEEIENILLDMDNLNRINKVDL